MEFDFSRLTLPRFLQWWDREEGREERDLYLRILIAIFWLPLQIILSLLFATGGLFLLLILGIVLAPPIGLGLGIWLLVRPRPDKPDQILDNKGTGGDDSGQIHEPEGRESLELTPGGE